MDGPSPSPSRNTPYASRHPRGIRSGDVYQLNFTIPLEVRAPGSAAALYRRLRTLQPAPYGAFLHTQPNHRILSFSAPNSSFASRTNPTKPTRRITTRPMKGTAPRGRTTAKIAP